LYELAIILVGFLASITSFSLQLQTKVHSKFKISHLLVRKVTWVKTFILQAKFMQSIFSELRSTVLRTICLKSWKKGHIQYFIKIFPATQLNSYYFSSKLICLSG